VTIYHFLCAKALTSSYIQGTLATVRSLTYVVVFGSICFIHAQMSLWIKAAGLELQHEIAGEQIVWEHLDEYQAMIQKYNKSSGRVVSIAVIFYFAAAASSCLTLPSFDGLKLNILLTLIACPIVIICLTMFFSSVVSAQGNQIIKPLYFRFGDTPPPRLDHYELASEIAGFVVTTKRLLRILIALVAFVFTVVPIANLATK